uniref:putative ATP-dependent RNA helicase TDRD9 n=1 Tax=Monopterus albus TaxID=43700 RepID=UPI0009B457A1|nr:putative ATP-dependent RNA helicase TDRD9 [Monopterus albus]
MHVPMNAQPLDYTSEYRQKFILQMVIGGAYYLVQSEIYEDLASRELNGSNPRTTVMVVPLRDFEIVTSVHVLCPEHTWSSTRQLETRWCCLRCRLPSSWASRALPWSSQSTPLKK